MKALINGFCFVLGAGLGVAALALLLLVAFEYFGRVA